MKSTIFALAAATLLAVPVAAYSQTQQGPTRAQVRAELQQLEQAGYNSAKVEDPRYPADVQAAEGRIAGQRGMTEYSDGYGGTTAGSRSTGSRAAAQPASDERMHQLYGNGGH
ncbi:hypothetical protein PPGU19_097380 (plasmid) [Paraburkholderia sp. PGU19]|uniref:DUF4148 domain-containing protein n=1 Tax=Paraburkholderia sp. PGU19 TaxID=2735434 RepID=UPI0015DAED18|nr:DUF4148 domain-containing protein [Paraburkholderia sp. PGU19]BCG05170.1 hypothetical protein PPGU19_097380 [Paraburkholderia sp. PGU19]